MSRPLSSVSSVFVKGLRSLRISTGSQSGVQGQSQSTGIQFGRGMLLQSERWKSEDRRVLIQSMPVKDMGTQGEKEVDIDLMNIK